MNEPDVISSPEGARDLVFKNEISRPNGLEMTSLIRLGTGLLEEAGIERPQWVAEQLLSERIGCLPVDLYVCDIKVLEGDRLLYRADVAARANGVPLQYLLGTADFYGRRFAVGPGVFNPRPETEILVDVALELLPLTLPSPQRGEGKDESALSPSRGEGKDESALSPSRGEGKDESALSPSGGEGQGEGAVVADVGAGSGAIAVTLAKERPELDLVAVERSSVALHFARRNALTHGCGIHFVHGNLLEGISPGSLDAIVANPPYLNPAQAREWPRELAWEPWLALDGGSAGLALFARLIAQAGAVLKPSGWMALEIGMDQADGVRGLAEQNGFRVERIVKDLANLDRVAVLWKN